MYKRKISARLFFIVLQHVLGIFLILSTCICLGYLLFFKTYAPHKTLQSRQPYKITYITIPTPTLAPTLIPIRTQTPDTTTWGVASHIGGPLWQIKLGADAHMATEQETFDALNNYRKVQGKSTLQWDQTLASYAKLRAQTYTSEGKLDNHIGFNDFLNNQDGFHKLGYQMVGENGALLNEPLLGVHIIEWLFAGDPDHNANQLDTRWSNVGIGVDGYGVDVVFGGSKF